jgi:hypothetical protein
MPPTETDTGETPVSAHGPELAVAALLALIGALVIADSLRVGAGWGDDGPRAGYFPFYIGSALLALSVWIAVSGWLEHRRGRRSGPLPASARFATRAELGRVVSVFWPMVCYVAAIKLLGIYVASALLIGWFMSRHGEHGVPMRLAVALGVPMLFFLVFERWFVVPLPKGPLEALAGL